MCDFWSNMHFDIKLFKMSGQGCGNVLMTIYMKKLEL